VLRHCWGGVDTSCGRVSSGSLAFVTGARGHLTGASPARGGPANDRRGS